MVDAFYTPPELAQEMVGAVPKAFRPKSIADFAAGEGMLLSSALNAWPNVRVFANDISTVTARKLSRLYPSWAVSSSNFLSGTSSSRAKYTSELGKIDLILINPPFSERGKKLLYSGDSNFGFFSGTAVAFLYRSLAFLSRTGCLIAILPNSCLTSDRDKQAWSIIRKKYNVDVICTNPRSSFKGVSASTSVVRIQGLKTKNAFPIKVVHKIPGKSITIHRGTLQMHSLGKTRVKNSLPLVHTSNLKNGKVLIEPSESYVGTRIFCGPGVLFPRVGQVTPEKICVLSTDKKVVLSDCVLAVPCPTYRTAVDLQSTLISNWEIFSRAYSGTGAPYITIERAKKIIQLCIDKQKLRSVDKNEKQISEKILLAA